MIYFVKNETRPFHYLSSAFTLRLIKLQLPNFLLRSLLIFPKILISFMKPDRRLSIDDIYMYALPNS